MGNLPGHCCTPEQAWRPARNQEKKNNPPTLSMLCVWAHWGEHSAGFCPSERCLLKPQPLGKDSSRLSEAQWEMVRGLLPVKCLILASSHPLLRHSVPWLVSMASLVLEEHKEALAQEPRAGKLQLRWGCLPLLPSDWPHSSPCPLALGAWEHAQLQTPKCLSWQVESVNKPCRGGNRSEAPSPEVVLGVGNPGLAGRRFLCHWGALKQGLDSVEECQRGVGGKHMIHGQMGAR